MKLELTNPALDKKGSARVIRGGNYHYIPYSFRAATRDGRSPSNRSRSYGFRLVKTK